MGTKWAKRVVIERRDSIPSKGEYLAAELTGGGKGREETARFATTTRKTA